MPLPLSLTQTFRRQSLLIGAGWRGAFAPYNSAIGNTSNNTSLGVSVLDLQVQGPFSFASLPAGFVDLGWIQKFKMTPASKIGSIRSGYRGAVRAKYRGQVGETFEFSFRESTRLAWKISTGSEVFNLMYNTGASPSTAGPISSSGAPAVPVGALAYQSSYAVSGQNIPVLFVPAGSGAAFPAGSFIVADDDYTPGTYGIVGSGGVNIFNGAVTDVDFLRKVSDFVSTVRQVIPNLASGQDGLVLTRPFIGGGNGISGGVYGPQSTAKVQRIKGFVAREGGTYLTEWSALFCMDTIDGAQIALYYPHVAPNQFRDLAAVAIEEIGTTDETAYELDCVMEAMAYDDPLDGETVVRYACYFPAPGNASIGA